MIEQNVDKPLATSRVHPEAGWVDSDGRPRGPNGFASCRRCGEECRGRRRTFCSDECVHEWKIRSQPSYAARLVLERDRGVCAKCGLDCVKLRGRLLRERGEARKSIVVEHGVPPYLRLGRRRLWEMNHVVPVVEGGGCCGLDGLETLCWKCHGEATRALQKRLREARKRARNANQLQLPLDDGEAE